MTEVNPTRMELLKLREKKKLAEKGHKLLKNKQDTLIMTFFDIVKELRILHKQVSEGMGVAYESILLAQSLDGVSNVKSAAFNYPASFSLDVKPKNIMGVKVQKIYINKKELIDIEYIGSSNQLIDAQGKFNDVVVKIIKIAELESTLRKLADEIKKTKRRLNSLEYIKIPKLQEDYNYIEMYLAEMERENFFRLKMIKEMLDAKEEEAENV